MRVIFLGVGEWAWKWGGRNEDIPRSSQRARRKPLRFTAENAEKKTQGYKRGFEEKIYHGEHRDKYLWRRQVYVVVITHP